MAEYVVRLGDCGLKDVPRVGGKNASIGEMISKLSGLGIAVPDGFATTAHAYRVFLAQGGLNDAITGLLAHLDVDDVDALTSRGAEIRSMIMRTPLPPQLYDAIESAWMELSAGRETTFAVRSSATAEDLPEASFAGQQESLLNVTGLKAIIEAVQEVFASLYNDRAIAYRVHQGFDHSQVALSAGVQHMVRSDLGSSGVVFTLDTESGFDGVVFVTSSFGLGEAVVQGIVNPDEFYVYKPALRSGHQAIVRRTLGAKTLKIVYSKHTGQRIKTVDVPEADRNRFSLSDEDVRQLAKHALVIEEHYGLPMDIEWAKDGTDGKLYILQARPETVRSKIGQTNTHFTLGGRGRVLAEGRSIGQRIGSGRARIVADARSMSLIQPGDVLVTDMTDPDWEPIMKRASAIVTNRGGRTCHAAIIARELGIPAVVGCGMATESIPDSSPVTVSCAEGEVGFVYEGALDYEEREVPLGKMPSLPVKLMMNVGNPDRAFTFAGIPNDGVGLARLEFIINRMIGVHPLALIEFETQDAETRKMIEQQMVGYPDPVSFFVQRLAEGIGTIAAAFAPKPVLVRLSDFKSNEYAHLIGGHRYEPLEENPMLGFRGAARFVDSSFKLCFELECRALRQVRYDMGLDNLQIMVPFVRTVAEARQVVDLLAANGLKRGESGLQVTMMCELPSNALLADQFLDFFDGMSIGSNDMTQLTLGLDRDSGKIAALFDERDPAVKQLIAMAISACRKRKKYVGICGQGPSDHPDLAQWLVEQGIDSISLNPDSVPDTWKYLAEHLKGVRAPGPR